MVDSSLSTGSPGGGASAVARNNGQFFPLLDTSTGDRRTVTSLRADAMGFQKTNSYNRVAMMRFGAQAAARTGPAELFFPATARYVKALSSCKTYGLTRADLRNAKEHIRKGELENLDPRIKQWLDESKFLQEQFARGPIGFTQSFSALNDDSHLLQRIDLFGNHAAGEILQALEDADTFYDFDMKVDGKVLTVTHNGTEIIKSEDSETDKMIVSRIADDIELDDVDAALRTLIFIHCSSASANNSNILIPDFGDNVIENIRALQIALYEAHMHIRMSASDFANQKNKILQMFRDGDITQSHAQALELELTYIYKHCQMFSDKPERDANGYRKIMHYVRSGGDYGSVSAKAKVKEFAERTAQVVPKLMDPTAWGGALRPSSSPKD